MIDSSRATVPNIDIQPAQWAIVQRILRKHVPQYPAWAFGSRTKWTARPYSDLDLAIIAEQPLPLSLTQLWRMTSQNPICHGKWILWTEPIHIPIFVKLLNVTKW